MALALASTGLVLMVGACGDDETSTGPTTAASSGTGGSGGDSPATTGTTGTGGNPTTTTTTTTTGAGTGGTGGSGTGGEGGAGGGGIPTLASCDPPTGDLPPLKLTPIANSLSSPVLVKGAGKDTSRLYIVEQVGRIRLMKDGVMLDTPFLDISSLLTAGGERGLLGLAFHPDYETNGRFFVHFSATGSGDTRLMEFARSADPDVADPRPVGAPLLQVVQPEPNHNGGTIEFGADGMLYMGLGDGGSGGDPHGDIGNGQNTGVLLGKILRLDVNTNPYAIPPGNLSGEGIAPEIWDYGVRNPWRASFDVCTGDYYIGDVGQGAWEEIDVEPAGMGQRNYGWRLMEGTHCFNPATDCDPNNITVLPVTEYSHGSGDCSVSGGYVYRGTKIPALRGTYLYGDYCSGRVRTLVWQDGVLQSEGELTEDLETAGMNISSFGQDASGEVYVVDLNGTVYAIDPE